MYLNDYNDNAYLDMKFIEGHDGSKVEEREVEVVLE